MKSILKMSFLLLMAGVMLTTSCTPVYQKELKSSYSLYNQAVDAETAYRVQQLEKEMVNTNSSATQAQFQAAYDAITKVAETHKDALGQDNLYGNVLALKSMCELNLAKYTDAANTASQALPYLQNSKASETSRDNALMVAMPGLIEANQLYEQMPKDDNKISSGVYTNLADLAKDAVTNLEAGRKKVSSTHPINEYLLMSKLAVYKNWLDIVYDTVDKDSSDDDKQQKRLREDNIMADAKKDIDELDKLVGSKKPTLIKHWKALIGLD